MIVGRGVQFGTGKQCVLGAGVLESGESVVLNESDFAAHFEGQHWTVKWKWSDGEPVLRNQIAERSRR